MENQKVALVTGASRGIGQAIAQVLAKQYYVIGTATTDEGAQGITAALKQPGLSGEGVILDVTNHEAAKALIAELQQKYGVISILVNNAGINRDMLMLRMKYEDWLAVINTNLNSVFVMTQLCLSSMVKNRWGRIVNISSLAGFVGNPGQVNYSAAKAGVIGLTKALALEIASRGITVNAVAPGLIDTAMTQKLTEQQREALLKNVPMHVSGTPLDIAYAVNFLVSEEARYITGQTIHVNGGMF